MLEPLELESKPLVLVVEDHPDAAQMLKDLRVLYMCGLPGYGPGELIDINVEAIEDDPDGLVRVDNAEFLARPLRLGSNEASALIVALHALLDSPRATGARPRVATPARRNSRACTSTIVSAPGCSTKR